MPQSIINPLHVVIVDPVEAQRATIRTLLQQSDDQSFRLSEANSSQAASGYLSAEARPDVVLLNVAAGDLSLLKAMRESGVLMPVIAITDAQHYRAAAEAMRLGAHDFIITTDLTYETLLALIYQTVAHFRVKETEQQAQNNLSTDDIAQAQLELTVGNVIEKVEMRHKIDTQQHRLAEQHRKIRYLASELTLAEQRERRRIAQILHDDLQQMLHGIHVQRHLILIKATSELREEIQPHLDDMGQLIDQSIEAVRSLSVELSPPFIKNKALNRTFEWLADHMARVNHLHLTRNFHDDCYIEDDDLRVLVFQLVRELLFNVVKHAETNAASLDVFSQNEELFIRVSDEGVGFALDQALALSPRQGFGLYSIRERLELFNGRLEIESQPGDGTQATIIIPKESHSSQPPVQDDPENFNCD